MADGTTALAAKPFLVHQLDRVENMIEAGETRAALALLAVARCRAEDLEREPPSTKPMDVVNDVSILLDQLLGLADLLTSVNHEELCDITVARIGYLMEGVLERARDRLCAAREVSHG